MASERRARAARENGARSRGPRTEEGKQRSAFNAVRHGLLAQCVVLENESREGFDELVAQYVERLAPADGVEAGMVEEMAAAYWRMRRAWAIENRMMRDAIRNRPEAEEIGRIAGAFGELAAAGRLDLIHRYETRLHRVFQRALWNLTALRRGIGEV